MNKYTDNTLLRKNRIYLRVNDSELALLRDHQNSIRAPGLSQAVIALLKTAAEQRLNSGSFQAKQESNKEKKEIPIPSGNAPARPRDFDSYFYQITDDESLRGMVEEFLNGELKKGVDLSQKTDLRDHFWLWLPKYRNKLKVNAARTGMLQDQTLAKREREAKSAAQQRQLDENLRAANSPEAQAERDRVFAKFGKPWRR